MQLAHYYRGIFSLALLLILGVVVRADDPILWKFKQGDRLGYNIVQEMTISNVEGGDDKLQSKTRQELDMTWKVKGVDDAGNGLVEYRFDRIRSQMTLPNGHLEYDSAKEGPPVGMAAINAPLYASLVKSPVEISFSPNGLTQRVIFPTSVQAALKKVTTSAAFGDLSKPEAFHTSFLPGFPALPTGPVEPGKQWSAESITDLGTSGKQLLETTYQYEGRREIDGGPRAAIHAKRSISFEPGAGSQRRVKEQTSEGRILFDAAAGRLQTSNLKHRATIAITVDKRVTEQKIDQQIEVKQVAVKD